MWCCVVLAAYLALTTTTVVAQGGCEEVEKRVDAGAVVLDDLLLGLSGGELQNVLRCLPNGAQVSVAIDEIPIPSGLVIEKPVAIVGGRARLSCSDQGVVIRSDDVTLTGLVVEGCQRDEDKGFIHVDGARNLVLDSVEFLSNENESGPGAVSGSGISATFRNVTADYNYGFGVGFLSLDNSDVEIIGCTITRNEGEDLGGAITAKGGTIKVVASVVAGNKVENAGGGGIHIIKGLLDVSGSDFHENIAAFRGGAICGKEGVVSVSKSNISFNTAYMDGGGIYVQNGGLLVNETSLASNTAFSYGGGMYELEGRVEVSDTTFSNNIGHFGGGGIYGDKGEVVLSSVNVTNNKAYTDGGGVYGKEADLELYQCNFLQNAANNTGGGVFGHAGHLKLVNTTFSGNTAIFKGGGFFGVGVRQGEMNSSNFDGNYADVGGGMYITGGGSLDAQSRLTVFGLHWEKNNAREGGGLFVTNGVVMVIKEAWFVENRVQKEGGAVKVEGITQGDMLEAELHFANTLFTSNIAGTEYSGGEKFLERIPNSGGGALSISGTLTDVNFVKSNFIQNKAGIGGAIMGSHTSRITLSSCDMMGNLAIMGGAVAGRHAVVMDFTNGIVKDNAAEEGGAMAFLGTHFRFLDEMKEAKASFTMAHPISTVTLTLIQFLGNTAKLGGGAVDVTGFYITCQECDFDSNKVVSPFLGVFGQGGGLRMRSSAVVLLKDSKIRSCTAHLGGGIVVMDGVLYGENLELSGNLAKDAGGAIAARFTPGFTIDEPVFECQGCAVNSNEASRAGVLYFVMDGDYRKETAEETNHQIVLNITEFSRNRVSNHGPLIIVPETNDIKVCCGDSKCSTDDALNKDLCLYQKINSNSPRILGTFMESVAVQPHVLRGHVSGTEVDEINVKLEDTFGNMVPTEATLVVKAVDSTCEISGPPVTGMNVFGESVVKGITLKGAPGKHNLSLTFTSTEAGIKIVEKFLLVEVRKCRFGETPSIEEGGCQACSGNSYNFDLSHTTCKQCPETKAHCEDGTLAPTDGFWHSNSHSDVLYPCLNGKACAYKDRTHTLLAMSRRNGSALTWDNGYPLCNQGYEGVLCGSCTAGYGRTSSTYCIACKAKNVLQFMAMPLSIAVLVVLVIFFVKDVYRNLYGADLKHTWLLPTISVNTEDSYPGFMWRNAGTGIDTPFAGESSIDPVDILKILVNFLQITIAVMSINNGCQNVILKLLHNLGWLSGMSSVWSYFALSCGFNGPHGAVYALALSALVPFMVWLGFVAFGFFISKKLKSGSQLAGDFKIHCLVPAMAILSLSYMGLTQKMVQIFNCKSMQLDTEKFFYWVEDTGVKCFHQSHIVLFLLLGMPLLVCVSLGFPIVLFVMIYRNRYYLCTEEMLYKCGHFYHSYHTNFAYWEVLILARKAAIALISVLAGEFVPDMFGGCLTVLILAAASQGIFAPFKDDKLNKMELTSLFVSMFAFIFGSMACGAGGSRDLIALPILLVGVMVAFVVYMVYEAVKAFSTPQPAIDERMRREPAGPLSTLPSHPIPEMEWEDEMDVEDT